MVLRTERCAVVLTICLVLLHATGCSTQQRMPARSIPARRVCVADFAPGETDRRVGQSFARRLAEQIRRLTSGTEVTVASKGSIQGLNAARTLQQGSIPVNALAAAQDRYAADVVVLGRITAHDPYFRPTLGVSVMALDAAEGTVLSSTSRLWDAASPGVKDAVANFYRTAARQDEKRYGRHIYLVSPGYFRRFAAHSLARELVRDLSRSAPDSGG